MAKKIVFPSDRNMTELEYEKLVSHLRSSAAWYAMNGKGNTGQIKEKMREKGVFDEEFLVDCEFDDPRTVNLWSDVVEFLLENEFVNDEEYASRLIEREVARGRGRSQIGSTLWKKKVESGMAERLLEKFFADEENDDVRLEGLAKALRAAESSSQFRKSVAAIAKGEYPKMQPRQAVVFSMMSKGYSYAEIDDYLDVVEWSAP